jgi:beta-glucosidase
MQVEGGADLGGRTPSVWDVFAKTSGRIDDKSTGDVATDFYHRYKEDIALMKSLGIQNFRLSLSWSRLIPKGSKGSPVNKKGLDFYNDVIDELVKNGISPIVTLYHWDLPQSLQDSYKGFISPEIVDDFVYFADVAFGAFGDRVKKWSTFNEPMSICNLQVRSKLVKIAFQSSDKTHHACKPPHFS